MPRCSAVDCKNKGIHMFPKDVNRRKQWTKALGKKNWKPSNHSKICAAHFKPEDYNEKNYYTGDPNLYRILKKTAVPSIFSFTEVKPENHLGQKHLESSRLKKELCLDTKPGPSGIEVDTNRQAEMITTLQEITKNSAEEAIKTVDKSQEFSSKVTDKEFKVYPISRLKSNAPSDLTLPRTKYIGTKRRSSNPPTKVFIFENQNGKISHLRSVPNQEVPSQIRQTSTANSIRLNRKIKEDNSLLFQKTTLLKIMKNTPLYIGIFKNYYFLINLLEQNTGIPSNHILLCLKKIRLNSTFRELADEFSLDPLSAHKIFFKNIPVLASVMRNFIVKIEVRRNVSCVIDCFEIKIEEPLEAWNKSLTWSDNKKTNTSKYLVSCNPDGLINYVSKGYGGRITDTYLAQTCDFTQHLEPCMSVLVNRDFKHLEDYLLKHRIQLLRSSSVKKGSREFELYASLKTHIDTVIGLMQVFNMLKPNACVNHKILKVLDDVVTIACALINFQKNCG